MPARWALAGDLGSAAVLSSLATDRTLRAEIAIVELQGLEFQVPCQAMLR